MSFNSGDTLMLAFDPSTQQLWRGVNGIWEGDPTAGTGDVLSVIEGNYTPMVSARSGTARINFQRLHLSYPIPNGFEPSELQP